MGVDCEMNVMCFFCFGKEGLLSLLTQPLVDKLVPTAENLCGNLEMLCKSF